MVIQTPAMMPEGNWKAGLVIDDGASDAQVEALTGVFSGAMGGPPGALSGLIGEFLGVERLPVSITSDGNRHHVVVGDVADYQLTRVKLARMAAHLLACRQITYGVAGLMDEGSGDMEASGAKLFASKTAEWFTREALQIHGGMGYAEETPVSRYFADARVLSIFEGTEEVLATRVVARELLERGGL